MKVEVNSGAIILIKKRKKRKRTTMNFSIAHEETLKINAPQFLTIYNDNIYKHKLT